MFLFHLFFLWYLFTFLIIFLLLIFRLTHFPIFFSSLISYVISVCLVLVPFFYYLFRLISLLTSRWPHLVYFYTCRLFSLLVLSHLKLLSSFTKHFISSNTCSSCHYLFCLVSRVKPFTNTFLSRLILVSPCIYLFLLVSWRKSRFILIFSSFRIIKLSQSSLYNFERGLCLLLFSYILFLCDPSLFCFLCVLPFFVFL